MTLPLGVRQRLSLAVAVIHSPDILILDEPTSGVDPQARDDFWQLLLELSRRDRVTIFISTHFMDEGDALRPHLVDACRPGAGHRHARRYHRCNAVQPRWKRRSSASFPQPCHPKNRQAPPRSPPKAMWYPIAAGFSLRRLFGLYRARGDAGASRSGPAGLCLSGQCTSAFDHVVRHLAGGARHSLCRT